MAWRLLIVFALSALLLPSAARAEEGLETGASPFGPVVQDVGAPARDVLAPASDTVDSDTLDLDTLDLEADLEAVGAAVPAPQAVPFASLGVEAVADDGRRPWRLSVAEACQEALRSNLTLAGRRYDLPMAHQRWIEADASFDRLLTAGFELGREERPSTSTFFGARDVRTTSYSAYSGITRRMRDGSTISVLYRADRFDTDQLFSTINPAWQHALSGEIRVPLGRGGERVAANDIRRAQNGMAAARALEQAELEQVLLAVVEAYWNLVFSQRDLQAKLKSEDVAGELLEDASARVRAEVATPLDVSEARAGMERRRSDRLLAALAVDDAQDALRLLIRPMDGSSAHVRSIIAIDEPEAQATARVEDLASYVGRAMVGRPELRAQDADVANRSIDLLDARDALRPQLDLTGTVGSVGYRRGFDASLTRMLSGDTMSVTLGIELSMFLGQRAAKARWRAAGWARHQADIRRRETRNQVVGTVRRAHRALVTSRAVYLASRSEVSAAEEGLEGELLRLRESKSTPFRILQKEEELTTARTRMARSAVESQVAQARLWWAVGTLTAQLGLQAPAWDSCRVPGCRPIRR